MDIRLIPKKQSVDAKKNFDPVKWKVFARRMQKNTFMRYYILNKYNRICPWCKKRLFENRFVLHHVDYEHQCINRICKKVVQPTPKYPNRTHYVPDCEECYKKNRASFEKCACRVVPVHAMCNKAIDDIHKKNKREYK